MISHQVLTKCSLLLFLLSTAACSLKFQVEAPNDDISEACQSNSLQGVEVFCKEGSKKLSAKGDWTNVPLSSSSLPGLVVFAEIGTAEANERLANDQGGQNPMADLLSGKGVKDPVAKAVMRDLTPHLRTMANNLLVAHLKRTISTYGAKYGRIYFVRGNTGLKNDFLNAIKIAVKNHPKVDIFAIGHGGPSNWSMDKDLKDENDLTSTEVISFAKKNLSLEERGKVKTIFNTQCFMAMPASETTPSMLDGFVQAFPHVNAYGSLMINFMFFHRDWVMFEKYYETGDFKLAYLVATEAMTKNIATRAPRASISFPAMAGKGCIRVLGFKKCEVQSFLMPSSGIDLADGLSIINSSFPVVAIDGRLNVSEATPHLAAIASSLKYSKSGSQRNTAKAATYMASAFSGSSLRDPSSVTVFKPKQKDETANKGQISAKLGTLNSQLTALNKKLSAVRARCETDFLASKQEQQKAEIKAKCDEEIYPMDNQRKEMLSQISVLQYALAR